MLVDKSVREFIDELASSSPTPGGGSTAAIAGAVGAALASMVARLTIGRKKYAGVQNEMEASLTKSEQLRIDILKIVDEDAEAFRKVMSSYAMPKVTNDEQVQRAAAIEREMKNATLIPLHLMELCEQAMELVGTVGEKGNANSASDAGVGALMINAACMGAKLNVQINLGSLHDDTFVRETNERAERIAGHVEEGCRRMLDIVGQSISLKHS